VGGGFGQDRMHDLFVVLFRDGEKVAVFDLQDGVFDVPGDGDEGLEIGRDLIGLESFHAPGDERLQVMDGGHIERQLGTRRDSRSPSISAIS